MSESRMSSEELIGALRRMAMETGSLNCLGCGHEHGCSIHGCAVLKAAAELLERRRWISVEERMPASPKNVLVRGGNYVDVDAVPVVRCRDCKHCDPENHHCDHHMGTAAPLRRKHDDFCSYGERKDGNDNG